MPDDATERQDLLAARGGPRRGLLHTVSGLTEAQARERTTVSALCLGGILKHVASVEERWIRFLLTGTGVGGGMDPDSAKAHAATFEMAEDETLAELVARYEAAASATTETVRSVASLDQDRPLPEAPWFPPGTRWTARRVLLHILSETAQHCGHADIIREALDGQKTMG
jgi:uncharacterized damage-inducible protein DinB